MDIVPIQLSLTEGDLITLWAPAWREDGEEWEGFLGDDHGVHAFPDAATLTAYVRTANEHDLADHPAWPLVARLSAPELVPTEDQCYDLVGVPEIVAGEPDSWLVSELAGITTMVRALADACGLEQVHDVLDSSDAFTMLDRGTWAFSGREGTRLWNRLADIIATRWDEVIDALDGVVSVPEVSAEMVATARREFADAAPDRPAETADARTPAGQVSAPPARLAAPTPTPTPALSEAARFWEEIGIDPIVIGLDDGDHYTLRCYLDDQPVFLGTGGRIQALPSARALARHLATAEGAEGHDLTRACTWSEVVAKAKTGTLVMEVDPRNVYQLSGLGADLVAGPAEVDPSQLDLSVELLLDVGTWAQDDSASVALAPSRSLGWLTSFILRPDPTRLAPSPPFDAEAARWNELITQLVTRLRRP